MILTDKTYISTKLNDDLIIWKDSDSVRAAIRGVEELYEALPRDIMDKGIDLGILWYYWAVLHAIALYYKPRTCVELGVREAYSSDAFMRALSKGSGVLYSFDPVVNQITENILMPNYKDFWKLYQMTGEQGFSSVGGQIENIDLLYIDTDPHSLEQTKMWLESYWITKLAKGGIIVLDDAAPRIQEGVPGRASTTYNWGVLEAALDYINNNYDNIEYAYSLFNLSSNGILVIKRKIHEDV